MDGSPQKQTHKLININTYLLRHVQVMLFSLGQLYRHPISSLITIIVIGIALSLPCGLYVLLKNIGSISGQWDNADTVSIFLQKNTTDKRAVQLSNELQLWPEIAQTTYQLASQSLVEFQQLSGLENLLDLLPDNPLPAVISISPINDNMSTDAINDLLADLQTLPEVEHVKLDMQWLERLRSITNIVYRGVIILGGLLSLSVLLVIGNTIRLAVLSRQSEIRVMKLTGATSGFVRRPFLYTGFWLGALGGLAAWITIMVIFALLDNSINELANLYYSQFTLQWFAVPMLIFLSFTGIILGVSGAWLAVGYHINSIEPD